jgi:hypothetical protein
VSYPNFLGRGKNEGKRRVFKDLFGGSYMNTISTILYQFLVPIVEELVNVAFKALEREVGEAEAMSRAELGVLIGFVAAEIEITVRRMVRLLNEAMRRGKFEEVRKLIRENPREARRAANLVATRFKYYIRRAIAEELNGHQPNHHKELESNLQHSIKVLEYVESYLRKCLGELSPEEIRRLKGQLRKLNEWVEKLNGILLTA